MGLGLSSRPRLLTDKSFLVLFKKKELLASYDHGG